MSAESPNSYSLVHAVVQANAKFVPTRTYTVGVHQPDLRGPSLRAAAAEPEQYERVDFQRPDDRFF